MAPEFDTEFNMLRIWLFAKGRAMVYSGGDDPPGSAPVR